MPHASGQVTAVLGPTNTGKTHYAIERMLAYRSGVIGLPLRLLAREVYDRIVALRGPSVVALVTGEERIVPPRACYWIATVEAMPEGTLPDFLAIDEIQLAADPERGHVFTDRLLHARGRHETLFLGAETIRGAIRALVPEATFMGRERFSTLTYTGQKKLSRMPPRSAIVGFSVEGVYANAELIRRQKGGAAVVMGALSPRTRNAQVEMYQSGDVDFLVATDAIGMGLNLDIDHVAFAGVRKFDGRRMRDLWPNELSQIAGRAGRHTRDGTFGVTGEAAPLSDEVVAAIEEHRFAPLKKLQWRSAALDFGTPERLIASLEAGTDDPWLARAREADDLMALRTLSEGAETRARASDPASVRLLWDVCRVPDFRGISHAEHATLLSQIFAFLHQHGRVPDDWLARQVARIDRTDGEIDTLSKRLAYVRTWTYVAQRRGWVEDETHWRDRTRAVEDRLSDALHGALTRRFVDRRTSVLLRRLKQKEALLADVNDKGEVTVEGQFVGRLEGFRFRQDASASQGEAKTLRQASIAALKPQFSLMADRFYNAPDTEMDVTEQGGLMWGDLAVGRLAKGDDPMKPAIVAFVDEEAGSDVAEKVERRLRHFVDRRVAAQFEPLLQMQRDEALTGLARGFAFRLVEHFGIIPRDRVAQEVRDLDQDARGALRKHGIRFGQFTIFLPVLLKPAPTRLRLVLAGLASGRDEFPEAPPPGLVTIPVPADADEEAIRLSGYRKAGERAIRIDMLERLADLLRAEDGRGGFEAKPDMLSITGMTLDQFAALMGGLGYRADRGERPKAKPAEADASRDAAQADTASDAAPDTATDTAPVAEATPDGAGASEVAAVPDATVGDAVDGGPGGSAPADPGAEGDSAAAATEAPAEIEATSENEAPAEPGADEGASEVEATPEASGADVPTDMPTDMPTDGPAGASEAAAAPDSGADADGSQAGAADTGPETEVFYTFTWVGNRQRREGQGRGPRRDAKGKGQGGPKGKGGDRKGGKRPPKGSDRDGGPREYSSRPPRKEKPIDPDNPFAAALMGLKDKS